MEYPEEFKQKVLSTFGDNENVRAKLDAGSEIIGRYLNDASYNNISAKEIVEAFETDNAQVIYQKAKKVLALQELYREWSELDQKQYEGNMQL